MPISLKLISEDIDFFLALTIYRFSVCGPERLNEFCVNLKFWQKSLTDLMTSGFFCTLEFAGFVYINHSIEKSVKFKSLLNSRGNVANRFSWTCSFFKLTRDPSFSGRKSSWLSLICKVSRFTNHSKFSGRVYILLLEAMIVLRHEIFQIYEGSLVS